MRVDKKGFTLIELLIVTVIIAVLTTIAISMTLKIIERAHIDALKSDLSAAYKASVLYHTDYPDDTVTLDALKDYGYRQSKKVNLNIVDGGVESLKITATHPGVLSVYVVNQNGRISKQWCQEQIGRSFDENKNKTPLPDQEKVAARIDL